MVLGCVKDVMRISYQEMQEKKDLHVGMKPDSLDDGFFSPSQVPNCVWFHKMASPQFLRLFSGTLDMFPKRAGSKDPTVQRFWVCPSGFGGRPLGGDWPICWSIGIHRCGLFGMARCKGVASSCGLSFSHVSKLTFQVFDLLGSHYPFCPRCFSWFSQFWMFCPTFSGSHQ